MYRDFLNTFCKPISMILKNKFYNYEHFPDTL